MVTDYIVSLRCLHLLVVIFVLQITVRQLSLDRHSRMLPLFLISVLNHLTLLWSYLLLILGTCQVVLVSIEAMNWTRVHASVDE